MSSRIGRDKFNLTNTMSIFQKADVNIILLTSIVLEKSILTVCQKSMLTNSC